MGADFKQITEGLDTDNLSPDDFIRALQGEANVNVRDAFGESILCWAITATERNPRRVEIIRTLLALGADPKLLTNDGYGPLVAAAIIKDAVIIEMLLQAGADPNAEVDGGETAYDWAEFDYRFDEYDLKLPEEPTPEDEVSEEAWLMFLDRLAIKYGKMRPDYVMVLRKYGALRSRELKQKAASEASPSLEGAVSSATKS